ncbi:glycosyltransferase family 39 protein [Candidatus Parcubacteria bacterium]|nr:glycosyltransferase family 39 protein [Candidatus Parcubacteria bacterium]
MKRLRPADWLTFPLKVFGLWLIAMGLLLYFASAFADQAPSLQQLTGKWDSGWYATIVTDGYRAVDGQSNIAFFPGYPLAVKPVYALTGHLLAAGVAVSLVSFWLALMVVYRIARDRFDAKVAERTLLLLAFSPFSFFFGLFYTESLFLLLIALSLRAAQARHFVAAAAWAGLASSIRFVGVFLAAAVLFEYWQTHKTVAWPKLAAKGLGLAALAGSGLVAYMGYMYGITGDALAFVHIQKYWPGRGQGLPGLLDPLRVLKNGYLFSNPYALTIVVVGLIALFLALAVYCFVKISKAWGLFCLLAIAVPLLSGSTISLNRYIIVLFPCFVALALLTGAHQRLAYALVPSAMLLAFFSTLYYQSRIFLG